jgi:hypothetical protein
VQSRLPAFFPQPRREMPTLMPPRVERRLAPCVATFPNSTQNLNQAVCGAVL